MMYVEKFSKETHLDLLTSWMKLRGAFEPTAEDIPEIGYVVYDRGTAFAAGFLRKCEGNFAIFDGLATDPHAESGQRNQGLDLVVSQLIKTAKELELKGIIAWSRDNLVLLRSYRHGFVQLPQTVIALDLNKEL